MHPHGETDPYVAQLFNQGHVILGDAVGHGAQEGGFADTRWSQQQNGRLLSNDVLQCWLDSYNSRAYPQQRRGFNSPRTIARHKYSNY